jgi:hypothetical protein
MSVWNFIINIANARANLQKLGQHYDDLYDKMVGKMGANIQKWNIWEKMLDYTVEATKKLISESRELIAISTKYDIPIKRMGEFQMMAQVAGQSLGQVARNFRFLEMNFSRALLKPGGPQSQALHELGLNQEQITRAAGDTAYAMDIMKTKVMAIGEEERRNYFLQTMYGANWQNMLPILEMSKEQQDEMANSAHKYNEFITTSLALNEKNKELLAQEVKDPFTPLAIAMTFLLTGVTLLVQGFKTVVGLVKDGMINALQHALGIVRETVGLLARLGGKALKFIGLESIGTDLVNGGNSEINAGLNLQKTAGTQMDADLKKAGEGLQRMQAPLRALTTQGNAFMESVGIQEEGEHLRRLGTEMDNLKTKIAAAEANGKRLSARLGEIAKMSPEEQARHAAEKASLLKQQEDNDELLNGGTLGSYLTGDSRGLRGELSDTQAQFRTSGGKAAGVDGEGTKPRTAEEVKNQQDLTASMQKYVFEYGQVARAAQAEIETEVALAKAKEHTLQLLREIAQMEKDGNYSPEKKLEYTKKILDGQISLMEKEKAHKTFLHQKAVQIAEAERDRKEGLIASMEKREQTFMARQGMTGMDKQSVMVSNAVEKMVRDQEQLARVMADPMKTQAQKDAARKDVDASALKAQDELDKLSLMQFQYGASDAAKKGMGGGIDIRENQLTVAKSQLDILKQQLDLMRSQYGVSDGDYGNVPMMMKGALRAGK